LIVLFEFHKVRGTIFQDRLFAEQNDSLIISLRNHC